MLRVGMGSVDVGGQSGWIVFEQVVLSERFPEDQSSLRQHNTQPTRPKRDAREWSGIIDGEVGFWAQRKKRALYGLTFRYPSHL